MTKRRIVAVSSECTATLIVLGAAAVVGPPARADDFGTALQSRVGQLRQTCPGLSGEPSLRLAAQRHADDMLMTGVGGHTGSDGSSPQARIADAGYNAGYTGEIVYWGTGSAASVAAALDAWMNSPPHRDVILNCSYTAVGFATAMDSNKMTVVGDFAGA
ncbi:secretion protein [Mycobacterium sp. NS-7484]|uniref:CAP domain-containing protein n=1 Tax=unclassified Mycobacterium TaxID=2642494 RepID=UPI0007FD574F|nr:MULTISPECIES: CAP domain-containing protein [unclassified Mycobacterium]OBG88349.1 secretion protein [Mycobacterium sp. E802]OMB98324.1 secretion protein [Mycobacterium sp. NS-7484]